MIQAKELRVGNRVEVYNSVTDKTTIHEIDIFDFRDIEASSHLFYKPILLNEEWLLKFSFIALDDSYFYKITKDNCEINFDLVDGLVRHDSHGLICIKYVHQLQNIYYALTGDDLIILESK